MEQNHCRRSPNFRISNSPSLFILLRTILSSYSSKMLPNFTTLGFCLALLFTRTLAHMQMCYPPPLKSKFNINTGMAIDYDMTAPLKTDGSNFPCKGYHNLTETSLGTPMAVLKGGELSYVTITGQALHDGGSCQISLSVDGGQTFRVLHTYIGNCPTAPGDTQYNFRVPLDVPSKERALLAWTWFNKLGNREMYMNCASVTTQNGGSGDGFSKLPTIFKANIGNGCKSPDSKDLLIPNPGNFTTVNNANAAPALGDCETGPGASGTGASKPAMSIPGGGSSPSSTSSAFSPPLAPSPSPLTLVCPPCPACPASGS